MKKTRTKILAGVVLLAAVLLITGIVWAEATHTPIAGTETITVTGPPVRLWEDDEGIAHYRGLPGVIDFPSGDLDGTGSFVVNVNLDPVTGNGDESGAATINVTWGELSGTFEGRLTATFTAGISSGTVVYHGISGDFQGMKMMMSYSLDTTTGPPGTPWLATYEAIVLDPHGE
jgi:hypothetical protein